jgi:hypothetical protein
MWYFICVIFVNFGVRPSPTRLEWCAHPSFRLALDSFLLNVCFPRPFCSFWECLSRAPDCRRVKFVARLCSIKVTVLKGWGCLRAKWERECACILKKETLLTLITSCAKDFFEYLMDPFASAFYSEEKRTELLFPKIMLSKSIQL